MTPRPWLPILLILLTTPLFAETPSVASAGGSLAVAYRTSGGIMTAAVLTPSGTFLGQLNAGAAGAMPAVASDGTRYLAVWPNGGTLMGVIFDANANPTNSFAIGTDAADVTPAASWNGADYVVAWLRASGGYTVAAVSTQGIVERGAFLNVSTGPLMISPPISLASSGSTTLAAFFWSDATQAGIDAITLDASLVPAARLRLDSSSSLLYGTAGGPYVPQTPDVAASATEFFVTWLSSNGRPVPTTLRGARLGLDATLLDPTPLTLEISPASETDSNPRVAWDGRFFFETWMRTSGGTDGGTWVDLITENGVMSGPLQVSRDTRSADVSSIGFGRDVIAWVSDTSLAIAIGNTVPPRRRAIRE